MGDAQDHQRRLTRRRDETAADRALAEDRIAGRPRRDGKRACGCPKLRAEPVTCSFVRGRWPGMIRW
jgi:hypothetical protein